MAANEPSVPQVQPPTTSPRLDSTADVLPAVVPALIAAPTQCIPALQSTRARSLSPCSPRELASTPSSSGTVLVARKKTAATVSTDVPSIGNVVRDSILQPSRIVVNPVVPLSQLVVPTVIAHSKPAHASKKVAAHDVAPPLPVSALEGADTCLPLLVAQELQVPGDQPTANAALSTDTATAGTMIPYCLRLPSTGVLYLCSL